MGTEMQGDTIVIEEHHQRAADAIIPMILPTIEKSDSRYTISVAGESGSGKSEIAAALAEGLRKHNIDSIVLQQDDYFVYPPKSNDKARRDDISWVGPQEVKLKLMDENLAHFLANETELDKPLVIYEDDRIVDESMKTGDAKVAIAEGTYTSLLENIDLRIFINRTFQETRAHREKRSRHKSELDPFIDSVLDIEHRIISSHRDRANIIINSDYSVSASS
jgi:uridine kinase